MHEMKTIGRRVASCLAAMVLATTASVGHAAAEDLVHKHGIAMHGEPAYPEDFTHFSYANPDAPYGGRLTLGVQGTFDSLNPLVVRGVPARAIRGLIIESLMTRSYDEAFSLYGLLAESIAVSDDRSMIEFRIRPEARFSDGTPVTSEDVHFSFDLLRENGRQNHRTFYAKVADVEIIDERTIRFTSGSEIDRELPLILGLMPILSKAATDTEGFTGGGLDPLIATGPYVVGEIDPGASITYRRNPDYWGADLAVNRGHYNFEEVRYDYYRDGNTMMEAFKRGLYDVRGEDDPTRWATQYDFPLVRSGGVVLEELQLGVPRGMSALVFNTRRPFFADRRVRQALIQLFDFDWLNRTLYHGLYARTESYFEASELSSRGRPADDRERELLAPWMDYVKPEVLDGTFTLPTTDGSGRDRAGQRRAVALLEEAGYQVIDGRLTDTETQEPVSFEFLAATPVQERLALAYRDILARVGIDMDVRLVDAAQYQRRQTDYDFDIIQNFWFASLSPGNEQLFYWGTDAANAEGTRNYPGIENPALDAMIEALLSARDREDFVSAARALDRVLMSGDYMIPLFHLPNQWVARSTRVSQPETTSLFGYIVETWWQTE